MNLDIIEKLYSNFKFDKFQIVFIFSSINNSIFLNITCLRRFKELIDGILLIHHLDDRFNLCLFILINLLHGSIEQSLDKPRHVMNRTVNKELFDEVLARECFHHPEAQPNIHLESISDQSHVVWQNCPLF